MAGDLTFYFDFSSPYGYLASQVINDLAHRFERIPRWKPILLGVIFQETGQKPLHNIPLKGSYSQRDISRTARFLGVEYKGLPTPFPFSGVTPARAFYWLETQDPIRANALAQSLMRTAFVEQRPISTPEAILDVAAAQGIDTDALQAGLQDPIIKATLKEEVATALAANVFGSPFFIVDGESFWGADRLPQLEKWLETGGF